MGYQKTWLRSQDAQRLHSTIKNWKRIKGDRSETRRQHLSGTIHLSDECLCRNSQREMDIPKTQIKLVSNIQEWQHERQAYRPKPQSQRKQIQSFLLPLCRQWSDVVQQQWAEDIEEGISSPLLYTHFV
eukprot:scaffold9346_cov67-Attheya_sp.AAC.6